MLQNFLGDDTFTTGTEHGIVGVEAVDATHYPLTRVVTPGRQIRVRLEYRPDVVGEAEAQSLLDRFAEALHARTPTRRGWRCSLPGAPAPLGHTARDPDPTVAEMLAEQAALTPARAALTEGVT